MRGWDRHIPPYEARSLSHQRSLMLPETYECIVSLLSAQKSASRFYRSESSFLISSRRMIMGQLSSAKG